MGINVRAKGQRAEREAIKYLQEIVDRVTEQCGESNKKEKVYLERNQNQSNRGGYDIVGIEWLALEIKHQEKLEVDKWWVQCLRQAGKEQLPVLMYKQNNVKFRVRTWGRVEYDEKRIAIEMSLEDFLDSFEKLFRLWVKG